MAGRRRPSPCATARPTRPWPAPLAADAPATDQRGEATPGPAGTDPDIGAFELGGSPPTEDIVGTNRADFLKGTGEDDVIRGLAGNDTLLGPAGDDRLFGGNGKDTLFGKAGHRPARPAGWVPTGSCSARPARPHPTARPTRRSWISTAARATRSTCATIDANEGAPGNQPFPFVGAAALSGPAQLHVEAFDGDFLVTGNVDADPAADFAIVVRTDLASLRAADFLL